MVMERLKTVLEMESLRLAFPKPLRLNQRRSQSRLRKRRKIVSNLM